MRHAPTRKRHRVRPSRGRYAVLVAAVIAVATISWLVQPSGSTGHPAADARPSAPATATTGTAAPSPDGSATRPAPTTSAPTTRPPTTRPAATRTPAKGPHKKPTPAAPATTRPPAGAAVPPAPAGRRTITLVNRTSQTVWAVVTNTSAAYPGGRRLQPGQSTSLTVADNWGGRIWGRTGCAGDAGGHCLTGDCTTTCGGPTTPTTLGEFTFNAFDGMDFYDVSMVDGSNLPMWINIAHTTTADPLTSAGCYRGTCTSPVNCPSAMQAKNGGSVIGCMPPCAAFGGDTYCCRGSWAGRENCVPSKWPVDYTQVFKRAEPYAYSYAFDDSATMSCKGACYYRITFGTT
ncbi:thaumatin family protein [Streptomyces sp. KK5PA1]|uniref:Thaumatin family protein n=1 Tax=Actinacidiphila acididurans TaxID=2784346 RepID=A0ABS2TKA5_9ACTN|nr:thaumatin family protein [Actinacidiphila acididurans]